MSEMRAELTTKLIVGHKRDGRCVYSAQGKRELVEACLQPGVSVAKMALSNGVNANLVRKWISEYQAEVRPVTQAKLDTRPVAAKLLPVVQVKEPIDPSQRSTPPQNICLDSCIEIILCDLTVRVRGEVDERQLARVMDCLARRP